MKTTATPAFLVALLCISCSKENSQQQLNASTQNNAVTPLQELPLNDLGKGTFYGYTGGLYPNGENSPSGTYADDLLAKSKSIVPLDILGHASSSATAKIVFIS